MYQYRKIGHVTCLLLLMVISGTGCQLVSTGPAEALPPLDAPVHEHQLVPLTDGFDFPVGGPNGEGWAVTGYDFMDWSRYSRSWHPGEDWNIPGAGNGDFGEPVYAIANGVVVFSGWNTALGNIILIEHHLPDGRKKWSQYAHVHQRFVAKGDIVYRRQPIATVGRGPNNAFSAHLHFEIRKYEMPANAWPRTAGQAWAYDKVLDSWVHPSNFIRSNRPES